MFGFMLNFFWACEDKSTSRRADGETARAGAEVTSGEEMSEGGEQSLIAGQVGGSEGGTVTSNRCLPGQRFCIDERSSGICTEDGNTATNIEDCLIGQGCLPSTGECQEQICTPNESICLDEGGVLICNSAGTQQVIRACSEQSTCIDGQCLSPECFPQVLFMLDGSSSMFSEWERVQISVNNVIANNPVVSYGMLTFPVSFGCSIETGWPNVAMTGNAGPIMERWFANNGPAGGATPLISTMEWVAHNAPTLYPSPNTRSLIIMTEGLDRCRCDDDDDDFRNNAYEDCLTEELTEATQALVAQGIKVYIIGYKFLESREVLNVIAREGNTDFEEFIFAGNEVSLTNAFESIVTNIKLCQ